MVQTTKGEEDENRTRAALLLHYFVQEWLLVASVAAVLASSLFLHKIPVLEKGDLEVVWVLAVLLIVLKGLEQSGWIRALALHLERGRRVPLKLVMLTFFLSMVVTNDVALLSMVPLTLVMCLEGKGILVVLEALAANAGSALTPIGNPQNLFIFLHYRPALSHFLSAIAPFSLSFLALLVLAGMLVGQSDVVSKTMPPHAIDGSRARLHGILFFIVLLCILGILPMTATLVVPAAALLFDRRSLRIDYGLLLVFVCFFAFSSNLQSLFGSVLRHPDHVFLLTAISSQLISNVPATLLVAPHTQDWPALLWGASVGGFGSLVGSLANLIAFQLYARHPGTRELKFFALQFLGLGAIAFVLGIGLYRLFMT